MTPCEKLGYKVGDRFEVVGGRGNDFPWNEKGLIIVLTYDDGTDQPRFKFPCGNLWVKTLTNVRPLKPQTEAEKRGAKFGTMGVVKATGERVVFVKEQTDYGMKKWYVLSEDNHMVSSTIPSVIRLDHEPEYKEIPFSEATDEQRMDHKAINFEGYSFSQVLKTHSGAYILQPRSIIKPIIIDDIYNTSATVRVPA